MANYDASIRVNTKVENSDLRKLQNDFNKLEAKLDSLYKKGDKLEALGVDKQSRQWKSLTYDVAQTEMALEDVKDKIQEVSRLNIDSSDSGFKKLDKSSKKCFKTIQSGTKKSNGLLSTFGSRLKGIALSLLIFNWITKGFNAMVAAMKEGFQNLAHYSDDYNQSMSDLKSQMATLKNSLAAAFEPIANIIIPYIAQMVAWLNTAANAVGQFLAALQGKSTYTKAKKQIIDYAKSLDTASKSAKGALASFDSLNVLNKDNGGTIISGGEVTGAEAFETAKVESQIASFADKVKEAMQPFKDSIRNWFQGIDFSPLMSSLSNLKTACEPFIGYIYEGLLWLLENVLQPLGTWTIEDALPKFFEMLSAGMDALNRILVTLKPTFDYIWNNILVPLGEFTGEIFLWALDMIQTAFGALAEMFEGKGEKINLILEAIGGYFVYLWEMKVKPILQFIMDGMKTLLQYIVNIVGDIIDVLAGIIDFIAGVFTGDWERAWSGLVDIFKGLINLIIDIFEGVVNTIIDGLNAISFDVPEWVPGIGGQSMGINLARLNLPRLADGTVIQGGKPFAAILGDQRVGQTNIEAPLDTIKQAVAEVVGRTEISPEVKVYIGNNQFDDYITQIGSKNALRSGGR